MFYPNRQGCEVDEAEIGRCLAGIRPYVRHAEAPRRPPWVLRTRRLLDYLLVLVAEGEMALRLEGQGEVRLGRGDIFLVPPDTLHEMEGLSAETFVPFIHFDLVYDPMRSHWEMHIPDDTVDLEPWSERLHPRVELDAVNMLTGVIRAHNNAHVASLILALCEEAARSLPYSELVLAGRMIEILAQMMRGRTGLPSGQGIYTPKLELAAEIMRERCERELSMVDVAGRCGMSVSHFRQLFQTHFGMAPSNYLRQARIQRAKELMISTKHGLSEIAWAVGFANVHSFSRAFRAVEGVPPDTYRRFGLKAPQRA